MACVAGAGSIITLLGAARGTVASAFYKDMMHVDINFGLGILWVAGELLHRNMEDEYKKHLTLVSALKRIDMSCTIRLLQHPSMLNDRPSGQQTTI